MFGPAVPLVLPTGTARLAGRGQDGGLDSVPPAAERSTRPRASHGRTPIAWQLSTWDVTVTVMIAGDWH